MANLVHCEAAGSATRGFEWWPAATGSVTLEATIVKYGQRSIKITDGGDLRSPDSVVADAGGRKAFHWYTSAVSHAAHTTIWTPSTTGNIAIFRLLLTTGNKLSISDGSISNKKDGTTAIAAGTHYAIRVCWVVTSTTDWTVKVYLDGVLEITATNSDFSLGTTGMSRFYYTSPASGSFYYSPHVIDDGTDLADPSDMRCIPALPDAENTTNFDTAIGNARGASDFNNVNERPLSETNGWQHTGLSQAEESYILEQTLSALDVDLTGKTIIGHMAWCWAKKGSDTFTPCTWRAAISGTGNTTTGGTLVIPASTATGDSLFCAVTSQGSTSGSADVTCTDNDSGGNTWIVVTNTADKKAWLFWKRATSATASKTITIANGVTKTSFNCIVMQGAATSVTPYINVSTETNASGDETHATFTPDVGGCAIILSIHNIDSNNTTSTQSTASLGAMTERAEHAPAGAGADCAQSLATLDGTNAAAAATGSITWAQVNGATYSIAFACRPEATWAAAAAKLIRNGTDVAITLTTTSALYTAIATSATYPSGAFGMKSTGTVEDTDFFEGGGLIVYEQGGGNDLQAQASLAITGSADLDAIGALNAAASLAVAIATVLNATGSLAATASLGLTAAADLDAPGSLAAAASLTFTPVAVLNAPGTLEAAAAIVFTATADATAAIDDMDATAVVALTVSATLTASGTLDAAASVAFTTSADLTAAINNMDASAVLALTAAADLDATGTLQAAAAVAVTTTADLDATGALAATVTMAVTATADLDAIGNIASLATIALISSPDLDATGTLNSTAAAAISATADLDATGTLDAAAALTLTATADLTAPASNEMSATAAVSFATSADLDATGNLVAVVPIALSTQAVISAPGKLEAAAALALTVAADVDGALDASATATMVFTTAADLEGAGELRAADTIAFTGTAVLISTGALSGIALMTFTTAAIITDANAGTFPFINNPAAASATIRRGVNSTSPVRSAVSATVRREVVKTT